MFFGLKTTEMHCLEKMCLGITKRFSFRHRLYFSPQVFFRWLPNWSNVQLGMPHLPRAILIQCFSASIPGMFARMSFALCCSVLMTTCLCSRVWWQSNLEYWYILKIIKLNSRPVISQCDSFGHYAVILFLIPNLAKYAINLKVIQYWPAVLM